MTRAAILVAVLLATACGAFAPAPSASPRATEFVIPTRSPAPSVPPTAFTGHYGFLVTAQSGLAVRREDDVTVLRTIDADAGAVSPDGRIFAGWKLGPSNELRLFDVATGASRSVLTLPPTERFTAVTWSVDGQGLLYTVSGGTAPPAYSALRRVLLTDNTTAELTRLADGAQLVPAVWDRIGGDLVAAFVRDGDFAVGYVLVRGVDAPQRRDLPASTRWQPTPAVSGDGRWVLLAALDQPVTRMFRADDPGFSVEYRGTAGGTSAIGRPGSAEMMFSVDGVLQLWDATTVTGRARATRTTDIAAMRLARFDGSAVVVVTSRGLALLDLATFAVTKIDSDPRYAVRLP